MAHEQRGSSGFTEYYKIRDGQFFKESKEPKEGYVERVKKSLKKTYEQFLDYDLSGKIVALEITSFDYAGQIIENLEITLRDIDETYKIQLDLFGRYSQTFFNQLPNIDLTKKVLLSPAKNVKEGKESIALFVKQDGQNLKFHYTKAEPNGMPQMIALAKPNGQPVIKEGKQLWDSEDRENFIREVYNKYAKKLEEPEDLLEGVEVETFNKTSEDFDQPVIGKSTPMDSDDLPF